MIVTPSRGCFTDIWTPGTIRLPVGLLVDRVHYYEGNAAKLLSVLALTLDFAEIQKKKQKA